MGTQAGALAVDEGHLESTGSTRTRRVLPQAGDVLASARTARADVYTISIVPAAAHLTATRHAEAIEKVRELAHALQVDGWFTCNHTHYARVANCRKATGTGELSR
jgi:hypothetical protein